MDENHDGIISYEEWSHLNTLAKAAGLPDEAIEENALMALFGGNT